MEFDVRCWIAGRSTAVTFKANGDTAEAAMASVAQWLVDAKVEGRVLGVETPVKEGEA